ncbi:MAG TPA: hypothetical protein VJT33_08005 [bacterium]|nr:hypothetical protein [bacterium]
MRRPHTTVIRSLGLVGAVVTVCAAAAAPAPLSVSVVSVTTPVARGTEGYLVVRTAPNAQCGAFVQSQAESGRTIASLSPQTAGSDGLVTFSVRVPGIAKPGPYPVTVSCQRGAKAAVAHLRVTVR